MKNLKTRALALVASISAAFSAQGLAHSLTSVATKILEREAKHLDAKAKREQEVAAKLRQIAEAAEKRAEQSWLDSGSHRVHADDLQYAKLLNTKAE